LCVVSDVYSVWKVELSLNEMSPSSVTHCIWIKDLIFQTDSVLFAMYSLIFMIREVEIKKMHPKT
jgi:hypothetical protein